MSSVMKAYTLFIRATSIIRLCFVSERGLLLHLIIPYSLKYSTVSPIFGFRVRFIMVWYGMVWYGMESSNLFNHI